MNIGTLLAFVLVCIGVLVLRKSRPDLAAAVPSAVGAVRPIMGVLCCLGSDGDVAWRYVVAVDRLVGNRTGYLFRLR